jgi:hypothetical protein
MAIPSLLDYPNAIKRLLLMKTRVFCDTTCSAMKAYGAVEL